MSQAGIISTSSGPVPPTVATSYVTDVNSPAVPAANVLNVLGRETTANNDNGIRTDGSSGSNTLTVQLTNRATGAVTTIDATPTTALTFNLGAIPGVYFFEGFITAFDITDTSGGCYSFVSGARTTGGAGTEIGTEFKDVLEEVAMTTADFSVSVLGNNFLIVVTGINLKTINWNCYLTYRFVS